MRKRKRLLGVMLIIAALVIMTLPVSEADAASSASDFVMEGSTLVKYRGTEKNVSVPDTVEVIGESAFEDKTGIELVVLSNSVKRIEAYAFWGCDSLDTVVLGKGLKEIGDYAFAGCKGLKQISVPANVTAIGAQAFGDCVNMTDISIPVETVKIHESAFDGCAKLTFHCQEGSAADIFAQAFYEKQKEMPEYEDIPGYDKEDESGNQEESIPSTPLANTTPTPQSTTVPMETYGNSLGSTHVVGNRAVVFLDAGNLSVKQGTEQKTEEVQKTEQSPEETQEAVKPEMITEAIPKYTIVDGSIVADQAYYRDNELERLLLSEGILEIGEFSFARSSLKEIFIPDGVTDIAFGAFYHCDNLKEVIIPDTVCNVAPMAFAKTGWVENFLQDDSEDDFLVSGGVLIAYRGNNTEVSVPEGVRVIAAEVFQGHKEIESLKLPESVRVIGEAAFEDCTGLKTIQLNQGVEKIKDRAFCGVPNANVSIPATVKELGLRAFDGVETELEGERPEQSYEPSATRLSNESYRVMTAEKEDNITAESNKGNSTSGVTVIGQEGACARLEGADKTYELTISRVEDESVLRKAWERAREEAMPESMEIYEWKLTDSSGIPLTKLGRQMLTVIIPVQDTFLGKELKVVTTDRNGQLEAVAAKRVLLNGKEALSIQTSHLSLIGIYSVGEAEEEVLEEAEVFLQAAAAPGVKDSGRMDFAVHLAGTALLFTGGFLCIPANRKKKTESDDNL